jgi:hypothetical protein
MSKRIAWRFRKGSRSAPVAVWPCGCKYYIYTGQCIRYCAKHEAERVERLHDLDTYPGSTEV